ncbi:MAG: single-stranded DNA-binding protein [Clostridia bacterium]|nr:single-stranded DNA-binding protein [Clostridia bacterium]
MNTVQLIGRLTSDPVITEIEDEYVVAKFNLAVDKNVSTEKREKLMEEGKPVANFPRVQVWGKQAKLVETYLSKGKMVGVVGELQTDVYEHTDGETRYATVVNANQIKFL